MTSFSMRLLVAAALACVLAESGRAADAPSGVDPGVARRITPQDVQKRQDAGEKALFVDTRSGTGDTIIQGAEHLPSDAKLEAWAKGVPKSALIVTYCT